MAQAPSEILKEKAHISQEIVLETVEPDQESFEKAAATLKGKVAFIIDDDEVLRTNLNRYLCPVFEIYQRFEVASRK